MNSRANSRHRITGVWQLCPEESRVGNRMPQSWVQKIEVAGGDISVREEIMVPGATMKTALTAKFDGKIFRLHAINPHGPESVAVFRRPGGRLTAVTLHT